MRRGLTLVIALLALAGCGQQLSQSGDGGRPPVVDAGTDGGVTEPVNTCAEPATLPDAGCGSLAWNVDLFPSRPRNHHFTFLAESDAGTFLYAVGGANAGGVLDQIDRAPLSDDGSEVGQWELLGHLPAGVGGMSGGVVGRTVVFAGGMKMSGVTDEALVAQLQDDGTLSDFVDGGSTGHPRMHPGAFVHGNDVYVLGGFNDPNVWDDVVRATVQPDGTLSPWTAAGTLPGPRSHFSVAEVGGYIYLAGGLSESAFSNPPAHDEVFRARIASDGSLVEWTAMPPLPVKLSTHAAFFYGGYLYEVGGLSDNGASVDHENRTWRAAVSADHSLGPWEQSATLPIARAHVHHLPVFKNHVYSVAGAIDFNLNSTDQVDVGTFLR